MLRVCMEKRSPAYDLEAFKAAVTRPDGLNVTGTALRSAASMGFTRDDIIAVLATMRRSQFYKSMTSYADHKIWQDVYHVPSEVGLLYVKFTADVVAEFLLLSFKEKDDD